MSLLEDVYRNKKIVITGHTGFKGSWLALWLTQLGAQVYGISQGIPTQPSHFKAIQLEKKLKHFVFDMKDYRKLLDTIKKIKPDFIFHLAAQALVKTSYENPLETFTSNVMGTNHLLEALRQLNPSVVVVMITSDKAYDNLELKRGYHEDDRLGGKDPYSASKGAAELVIKGYVNSFFKGDQNRVRLAIARAGNVIGGGDWAKDRIVPDCVKAWSQNQPVKIRYPQATRPWQHVLEPLSGYLWLAQRLAVNSAEFHGEAFNFGPAPDADFSVIQLLENMQKRWPGSQIEVEKNVHTHEATLLKLDCEKALQKLKWHATLDFAETVAMTVDWYQMFYQSKTNVAELSLAQIENYTRQAKIKQQPWAL